MASSIVKSAAQQLGSLLVEEAKYLYSVRRKIESLQMELEWIQCFLKDADTQQHRDEVICKWVSQVRDFAYDGEDIVERFIHEVSHHQRDGIWNTLKWFSCMLCTCDARTLHNLGSEIDYLTLRMSELTSRLQRYGVQLIRPTRSMEYNREDWRTYSHTEEDVVGLKEDIQKVVDQLLKTEVKVVGISGTGGLGKTTLARKVFKHKDIKDHFNDNCAWVYISKEFDNKTIFEEIVRQLEKGEEARKRNKEPLKIEELGGEQNNDAKRRIEQLAGERNTDAKIWIEQLPGDINKLLQEKKCLVVVDDIWTETAWKNLKPAFESIFTTTSSSKILVTTRNQGLVQHVDPSGYPHLLQPLTPDDSWELLKRKAFIGHGGTGGESSTTGQHKTSQNDPEDDAQVKHECDSVEEVGRKMLKHCDGLPIAIVALGGILSNKKTISEWKEVEKHISSYLMDGIEEGGGEDGKSILKVLELSYNDLPFYLKPCFLYLGNFPEDYRISIQRLYHLWEAEGFLAIEGKPKKKGGTSYDIGERYLNELVQRSMVQVGECWTTGRIKTCQVHDVMRDMCLKKCEEVSFLHYIECTGSDVASAPLATSNEMKILRRCALYDEKGEFLDTHFQKGERATGLRSLLVFHEMKKGTLQNIWKAFPLLRVLDLEGSDIDSVDDGVGHLIHLRYLSLRKSGVNVLSSHLYDLKYLETLDLRGSKWNTIKICNEFHKMKRLRHLYLPRKIKVKGGKKLTFPTGSQMETIKNFDPERCETKELLQMTNLRVFSIRRGYTFEKAEELKWVLEAPVIKKAGQLINRLRLGIKGDVIKEDPGILSWAAHHPCFNELRVFQMKDRNINVGNANDVAAMGNTNNNTGGIIFPEGLTVVEFQSCEIGEGDVLALEKLPHLKSLRLEGSSTLATPAPNKLSFSPCSFPKLTQLNLFYLKDELEELEVGEGALPNLQTLKLNRCTKVKNIPESLTQVELKKCEIGEQGGILLLALEKLPRLQQLIINGLIIAESGGVNKLSFSPRSFPQVAELDLVWHPELMEWEIGDGALPNLQLLRLHRCKTLNKVNNLPNSLTQVDLWRCVGGVLLLALENLPCLQQLKIWFLTIGGGGNKMSFSPGSFPQLRQLCILYTEELEEWEVGEGALPTLQRLKLRGCKKMKKLPEGLPKSVDIECESPCIKGIEKYNTCPYFKKSRWQSKAIWWLHDSCA